MTTRTPPQMCPECGYVFDAASVAVGKPRKPRPGDISLCLNCITVGFFNADLTVRRATELEIASMSAKNRELIAKARAVRAVAPFGDLSRRGGRA